VGLLSIMPLFRRRLTSMGCLLLGFLVRRLGVVVVRVCCCYITFGISNVSGGSLAKKSEVE